MTRRKAILAITLALIAAALYLGFRAQPVPVETHIVGRGPLAVIVEEEGKTRVHDRYIVSSPVAGFARRVELDVGDVVTAGDTLVTIAPSASSALDARARAEAEASLAGEEAALREAEENARAAAADAEYAAGELERRTELLAAGTVSTDEHEAARNMAQRTVALERSARFAVDVGRHRVAAARTRLEVFGVETDGSSYAAVEIVSPVDGQVLAIPHESAGAVLAGEPLIEIGDPRSLEVEVDVLTRDAVRISVGIRVAFERWGGEGALAGRVRRVEPAGFTKFSALGVEEQRVLIICDFEAPLEARARLGDGYRVEATFYLWESAEVLQVPTSALFRKGGGEAVFVLEPEDEIVRVRTVETGHRGGLATEITRGLEPGEIVVTHPPRELVDGSRARRAGEDPRGNP